MLEPHMNTFLYLLVFPEKNIVKIGKANDIKLRIGALKKWWGHVDYNNSYSLEISEIDVFKLEKSLHLILANRAVKFDHGDGKTEVFGIESLEIAVKHIELYLSDSNNSAGNFLKGINHKIKEPDIIKGVKAKNRAFNKHKKKLDKSSESIRKCTENFISLKRLILFLYSRRFRIPFQYNICNGILYFRVTNTQDWSDSKDFEIMNKFSFHLEDSFGYRGINFCSIFSENEVKQYEINFNLLENNFKCQYFEYFFIELENTLKLLPEKSPAALSDIPILDSRKLFG